MPRIGKAEEDWNGLKLGFLKTVQPKSFPKLIPSVYKFCDTALRKSLDGTFTTVNMFWEVLYVQVIFKAKNNHVVTSS